jgi:hypothetical protein
MPSNPCQPSTQPSPVSPVPITIFQRLPQSHQQQLAYLVASLIRRVHATRQSKEGKHEH